MARKSNSRIIKNIKKNLPAVVSIIRSKNQKGSSFDLFDSSRKKIKLGGGSGFIVDKLGIIFTNRHVVGDPKANYLVILQDGEKIKPEILAKDPVNDIAVLKISSEEEFPYLKLGDSSKLELGEKVVAIGNALGIFSNTVSLGVVSGLSRVITAQNNFNRKRTRLRGLIQTDAAINPGNSGGPLIDETGKVIGINAAMVSGAENIGFALPINNAKKDLKDLKEYGRIRQPFLGVRYIPVNQILKEKLNLPVDFGALVIPESDIYNRKEGVVPKSPADKAGIKETDIIVSINDKKITNEKTIDDIIQDLKIGEEVEIKILRKNKEKKLKTILVERNF